MSKAKKATDKNDRKKVAAPKVAEKKAAASNGDPVGQAWLRGESVPCAKHGHQ